MQRRQARRRCPIPSTKVDRPMRIHSLPHSPGAETPGTTAPSITTSETRPIAREPGVIAVDISAEERARVVRFCLRYTRDPDAAEDLAQEALVEAWRGWHKLRDAGDPEARGKWLAAIAANVCRRWARRTGREASRLVALEAPEGSESGIRGEEAGSLDWLADGSDLAADIEAQLDRAELVTLVEKALALLPPETRDLLLARYLLEEPPVELAARRGLSEATLAVRLHRARQAMRRLLATTLHAEATAFGLVPGVADDWQETRIWCPTCGEAHLRGRFDEAFAPLRHLELRCPRCGDERGELLDHVSYQEILGGVQTFKAALNRVMAWADPYYRRAAAVREVTCLRCGRPAPILLAPLPGTAEARRAEPALHAACSCRARNNSSLSGVALFTPEGRRFWREHPRIRLAPVREVESGGREVIVVGYESVAGPAQIDTLFARDTFELLAIHTAPGA